MRCKNCGWNNPVKNEKCEKCNAPLEGSMIDGAASGNNERQMPGGPNGLNLNNTAKGCPDCGYPQRPGETGCPNCGRSHPGSPYNPGDDGAGDDEAGKQEIRERQMRGQEKQTPPVKGTFIQGTGFGTNDGDESRRKLVGFLVTYSLSSNGDYFALYEGKNSVGRNASNDIVIQDKAVSGEHLVIAYYPQNRKFYFDTVGLAQNGTYVNGKFYPKGGDELLTLDVILIGATRLTFIAVPEVAFE